MERCARTNTSVVGMGRVMPVLRVLNGRPRTAVTGLLQRAFWLTVVFGIAHLAGMRGCTLTILQGPDVNYLERFGCMTYLFLYGSFVIVVPVLVMAAGLLFAWNRAGRAIRARRRQ